MCVDVGTYVCDNLAITDIVVRNDRIGGQAYGCGVHVIDIVGSIVIGDVFEACTETECVVVGARENYRVIRNTVINIGAGIIAGSFSVGSGQVGGGAVSGRRSSGGGEAIALLFSISLGCVPLFSSSFDRHLLAYNGVVAITTDVLSTRTHRMNRSLTWPWPPRVAVATAFLIVCLFV